MNQEYGKLSSRQRVRKTLAREIPDRVPLNYSANPGIDGRLKQSLGVTDDEGLLRCLGIDFRSASPGYVGPCLHAGVPGLVVNAQWGWRTRYIEHGSGGYWDFCEFPLQHADADVIANWPTPSPDDYDYAAVRRKCEADDEHALYVGDAGTVDIMNSTGLLMGVEAMLIALATEDPAVLHFIDRRLDVQYEVLKRALEISRGRIDFIWVGEDLGTQRGPMISMEMFRKILRPRHQRFVDLAKSMNVPVLVHSCGSSSWAYDDFADMGIAAVDTLQPEATDMSPAYLKQRYGGKLAFHGCISTGGPVAQGSVDDTVRNVCQTLEIMMPGGGYCLAPTHALQDNSRTENVLAMYETARRFGQYR